MIGAYLRASLTRSPLSLFSVLLLSAICLSNYVVGDSVRQLPCLGSHVFHQRCVDDWLKLHATCPCDRESLLPLMADPALLRARIEQQEARAAAAAARRSPLAAAAGASTAAARTTAATAAPSRLAASSPAQIRESAASRAESSTCTLLPCPVGGDEAELQRQQQTHQSESRDSSRRNSLQESKHNDQAHEAQQISIHLQP